MEGHVMFVQPGGKLKFIASILFWCTFLGWGILAFIIADKMSYRDFNALLFWIIWFVGAVPAYISSLITYAFGVAIEKIEAIEYNTSEIMKQAEKKD